MSGHTILDLPEVVRIGRQNRTVIVMRTARILSVCALVVMVTIIGWGLISGDFGGEGSAIWALTWGKVTLVDLYVGVVFFAAWVAWRERRLLPVVVWWVALVGLGNLAAAAYLVRVSFTSSDIPELLTGVPAWER